MKLGIRNAIFGTALLFPFGYFVASHYNVAPGRMFWATAVGVSFIVSNGFILLLMSVQNTMADAFLHLIFPSQVSTSPLVTSTRALALAAAGNEEAAVDEFERLLLIAPDDSILIRQAAEFFTTHGRLERAEQLLLHMRNIHNGLPGDELYCTHRLIDLYLGGLHRRDRALVELRRMIERFPNTPDAEGARMALRKLREDMMPASTN